MPATIRVDHAAEILRLGRELGAEDLAEQSVAQGHTLARARALMLRRVAARQLGGYPSIGRIIGGLAGGRLDGIESDYVREWADAAGRTLSPGTVFLPWGCFTRDLTVDDSAAFLVAGSAEEARLALRPHSVVANTGLEIIERASGSSILVPQETVRPTVEWIDQYTTPSGSTPTLAGRPALPHMASGSITISRELALTAGARLDRYWRATLLRAAARDRLGRARRCRDGRAAARPRRRSGHQRGFRKRLRALWRRHHARLGRHGGRRRRRDPICRLVDTRTLLATRERASGNGGFIWDADLLADRPAAVSTLMPDASLLAAATFRRSCWSCGAPASSSRSRPTRARRVSDPASSTLAC